MNSSLGTTRRWSTCCWKNQLKVKWSWEKAFQRSQSSAMGMAAQPTRARLMEVRRIQAANAADRGDEEALEDRFRGLDGWGAHGVRAGTDLKSVLLFEVSAAEVFFQPDVAADEEVAAAHFLDLQLGDAGAAIAPGDRHDRPGVAAHDGLERQLDREVEVRRNQGTATVDHRRAIGLEGIGRVVERDVKDDAHSAYWPGG